MSREHDQTGKSEEAYRTIGEVAESLDLPAHVLRFWETRFKEIDPIKRAGGRRYYRPQDVALVRAIRHLLYGEGYTIKGVQRILKEQGPRAVTEAALARVRRLEPTIGAPPPDAAEATAQVVDAEPLPLPDPEPPPAETRAPGTPRHLPMVVATPDAAGSALSAEDVRRLRLALADLAEARRLLTLDRE